MVSLSELSNQLKSHQTSYQEQLAKIQRTKTFQNITKSLAIPQSSISGGIPQVSGITTNRQPTRGEFIGLPGFNLLNQIKNVFAGVSKPTIIPSSVPPIISSSTITTPNISKPTVVTYTIPTQTPTPTVQTPFPFFPSITTGEPIPQANPPGTSKPFFEVLKDGFNQIPPTVLLGIGGLGFILLLKK